MSTTHPALVEPFEVIRVTDSRDYVEDGDRMVPVPGTGDARPCDRCGASHEIHVEVTDANGNAGTVGLGCAGATRAREAQLRRKAGKAAADAARDEAEVAAVAILVDLTAGLPPFPADRVTTWTGGTEGRRTFYAVDGVKVSGHCTAPDDPERLACLADAWTRRQVNDLAAAEGHDPARLRRLAAAHKARWSR